jgi:putative oxidoreductase
METITRWNRWANAHTNVLTTTLRVLFGAFIFYKGIMFLDQTEYLYNIFRTVSGEGTYFILVHYVALAHLCGGVFIMMGLMTRFCSLVQIPILVGAVTINFIGAMDIGNLIQALTAFFVCVFFMFYGSGKRSVDHSLRLHI